MTRKSWQSWRLGSYGNSKAMIRFTAPAEVKGVALLVINHPDRSSDQWMWTPAIGTRPPHRACRIAPRASSAPISASKIWKSATSISSITS